MSQRSSRLGLGYRKRTLFRTYLRSTFVQAVQLDRFVYMVLHATTPKQVSLRFAAADRRFYLSLLRTKLLIASAVRSLICPPKTRSFTACLKTRSFARRREAPKTRCFRASPEDAKLRSYRASELQPKTRSSEDAELQSFSRRRGASPEDAELQSFNRRREASELQPKMRSSEDVELQSFDTSSVGPFHGNSR